MSTNFTVKGISTKIGDTVIFRIGHTYDKATKHGKFVGLVPYEVAKIHDNGIKFYAKNIDPTLVTVDVVPIEQSSFILINTEDAGILAFKESWMMANTYQVIDANSFKDFRVYNTGTPERVALLRTLLTANGFDLQPL
jgi:hypothetical protein